MLPGEHSRLTGPLLLFAQWMAGDKLGCEVNLTDCHGLLKNPANHDGYIALLEAAVSRHTAGMFTVRPVLSNIMGKPGWLDVAILPVFGAQPEIVTIRTSTARIYAIDHRGLRRDFGTPPIISHFVTTEGCVAR